MKLVWTTLCIESDDQLMQSTALSKNIYLLNWSFVLFIFWSEVQQLGCAKGFFIRRVGVGLCVPLSVHMRYGDILYENLKKSRDSVMYRYYIIS